MIKYLVLAGVVYTVCIHYWYLVLAGLFVHRAGYILYYTYKFRDQ